MNRKAYGFLAVLALATVLAACGGGNVEEDANDGNGNVITNEESGNVGEEAAGEYDAESASASYQQNCASCHGGNLEGASAPSLQQVGSNYSQEEILDIIENGREGGMPAGLIQGDEAENVAAWLADHK